MGVVYNLKMNYVICVASMLACLSAAQFNITEELLVDNSY